MTAQNSRHNNSFVNENGQAISSGNHTFLNSSINDSFHNTGNQFNNQRTQNNEGMQYVIQGIPQTINQASQQSPPQCFANKI
jgi:hypothetical protein